MAEASVVESSAVEEVLYREAFERSKVDISAVPDAELMTVNVEAQQALTATLQGMPAMLAMRPKLVATFTNFDPTPLDKLADYAKSFLHLSTVERAAQPQALGADALLQEGGKLCSMIGADLNAAAERGAISAAPLKEVKGTVGYRNTADTLLLLAQIAHANWSKLEGKTHITLAELRRAEALAARINESIAGRAREENVKSEEELQRQRAFTLYSKAFASVRRDVEYVLAREGQLDRLAEVMPSIYVGRASGKKRPEAAAATPQPATPAATSTASAAPLGPLPGTGGRVGMPDSDPFTSA